jgi:hypothetical protein
MSRTEDEFVFERMMRPCCSQCGSRRLVWGTVAERVAEVDQEGGDVAVFCEELAASLGVQVEPGLLTLTSWKCPDCGEFGAFGGFESGP